MNQSRLPVRVALILAVLLVCRSVAAQDMLIPSPTATPPVIQLSDQWQLIDQTAVEDFEQPLLSVSVSIPVLSGEAGEIADGFNQLVADIVTENVDTFRQQILDMGADENLPPEIAQLGSSFELTYEVFIATDEVISIRFIAYFYSAGAAHPGSYSIPLNYDLRNGTSLSLADLFKPNAQYLELLSIYASQDLEAREVLLFPEGAEPTEENYRSWNITPDGLLITFDEYQVAPYAAGPQEVLIPYSLIPGIIDPDSVLASALNQASVNG